MKHEEEDLSYWDLEDCSEDDLPCHHSSLQILVLRMIMIMLCSMMDCSGPTWGQYRSCEDGCEGSVGHAELCPRPVSPRHWHWHRPRLLLCSPQGRELGTEQEMISLIAITGNKGQMPSPHYHHCSLAVISLSVASIYEESWTQKGIKS